MRVWQAIVFHPLPPNLTFPIENLSFKLQTEMPGAIGGPCLDFLLIICMFLVGKIIISGALRSF